MGVASDMRIARPVSSRPCERFASVVATALAARPGTLTCAMRQARGDGEVISEKSRASAAVRLNRKPWMLGRCAVSCDHVAGVYMILATSWPGGGVSVCRLRSRVSLDLRGGLACESICWCSVATTQERAC